MSIYKLTHLYSKYTFYTQIDQQSVSKLIKPGFNVVVEKGAGSPSHFSDADYEAAGAKVVDAGDVWKSDIIMKVSDTTRSLQFWRRQDTLCILNG